MHKIEVSYNKTLKLSNVCIYEVTDSDMEMDNLQRIVAQMENYIRAKGAVPIGPLVQYISVQSTEVGELKRSIKLLRQADKFIAKLEPPYTMKSVLRCKNCLFARFEGEEDRLNMAFSKLSVIAYEEDIPLTGATYTVFTSKSEDVFSADVFVEKAETV